MVYYTNGLSIQAENRILEKKRFYRDIKFTSKTK